MEEIYEVFDNAKKISVYNDGQVSDYLCGTKEYEDILVGWNGLILGSHQMPALGVSLDHITRQEIKTGLWVEFDFEEELEVSGMPFDKLLVKVQSDFYGFNIIRHTKEYGYDGRCYYLDLVNKNMSNFYDLLLKI